MSKNSSATIKAMKQPKEPKITLENIDPAFAYSIDTGPETRGVGMVVRVTHDPNTSERIDGGSDRRRFFVYKPGGEYPQYTMPLDEALTKNIKREERLGVEQQQEWARWLNDHANPSGA